MPNHTYSNPFSQAEVNDLVRKTVLAWRPTAEFCSLDLLIVCPKLRDVSPQRIYIALTQVADRINDRRNWSQNYIYWKRKPGVVE